MISYRFTLTPGALCVRRRHAGCALAALAMLAGAALHAQPATTETRRHTAPSPNASVQRFVEEGIEVTLTMEPLTEGRAGDDFREGEPVRFRIAVADTVSHTGVAGTSPAAWLLASRPSGPVHECSEKVAACLNANVIERPALDLNVFYVVVMNNDATLTVVDPLFNYGSTNLLAMVQLESPGMDWAATGRAEKIYVSMPAAKKVAIVAAGSWSVEKNIALPGAPYRVRLSPDGGMLWVGYTGPGDAGSGVAGIRTSDGQLAAAIPTGPGAHDIAISDDSRLVYVTNRDDGTVSVIDAAKLVKAADIRVGGAPGSIAFSPIAHAAYVADSARGIVTVVDGTRGRAVAQIPAGPGITELRFAPGGRLAFITDPPHDRIAIVDAAVNRVIQTAHVGEEPNAVFFSDRLAYVRHARTESVLMIPLDQVGHEGAPVAVVDFPGGQLPAGRFKTPSLAEGIVPAPGSGAVLVANPLDKTVYYYMEGTAAPMGEFSNYNREARGVMVVDRSLKQVRPGVYETVAQLPHGGHFDIPFMIDAPRIVHCFSIDVRTDKAAALERVETAIGRVAVQHLTKGGVAPTETDFTLRFKLTDIETGQPVIGAGDVEMVSVLAPGLARQSVPAVETPEPGVYAVTTQYAKAGAYYLYVACPSHGLQVDNPQFRVVRVVDRAITQTHEPKESH